MLRATWQIYIEICRTLAGHPSSVAATQYAITEKQDQLRDHLPDQTADLAI
jgi:hypothetical protein